MIFVIGATKAHPSEEWIEYAKGINDEFGNPFEVIELQWLGSNLHRNADYAKTRGFDDARLDVDKSSANGIRITYRQGVGSVMWFRPLGNVGPFIGKLAKTPRNMRKLAACLKDNLWRIKSPAHIAAEVKELSEKLWAGMSEEERTFNEKRVAGMHTHKMEGDLKLPEPSGDTVQTVAQDRVALNKKQMELEAREAEVVTKEKGIVDKTARMTKQGLAPAEYSESYLRGLKLVELRRLGRSTFNLDCGNASKEEIIARVKKMQSGDFSELKAEATGVHPVEESVAS